MTKRDKQELERIADEMEQEAAEWRKLQAALSRKRLHLL